MLKSIKEGEVTEISPRHNELNSTDLGELQVRKNKEVRSENKGKRFRLSLLRTRHVPRGT
jgi:hypothetical protein